MPALPSSNPAQFVQGAPVLHVADVEATAAFYRDVLGFTWDFVAARRLEALAGIHPPIICTPEELMEA